MKSTAIISFLLLVVLMATSSFKTKQAEDLSALMDRITKETKLLKKQIDSGKTTGKIFRNYGEDYQTILTANPSDESKKGEHFNDFAKSFLKETERLRSAEPSKIKIQYNAVIAACINCHSTYCPGPITMLKKMKVAE